jgi:plastocyanin
MIVGMIGIIMMVALFTVSKQATATDGDPIMDLGIFSWVKYQQKTFFTDIVEVTIKKGVFQEGKLEVSIYQPIIFENQDDTQHRLVFIPGLNNKMDYAYTSPVIEPEQRWGLEIHTFGEFPYQCTLHPGERGMFRVKL